MAIIKFKDVWEMYRIKFIIDGKALWENFWALKGVGFEVGQGETLGIIGENGAGKSTILKLIMEMLKPDRGEVNVSGRVSGLLELGAGFQPELTGKENVYLSLGLFGLTQDEIKDRYEVIVSFADLGKFINAPVKCYSQGMFVRLAFAIAIHVDPDILLIDDTLAVGDEYFQRRCIKKIFELKEQGKTIVLVTHDMNMLRRLCKRAIFLKEGRIVKDDITDKVMPFYTQMVGAKESVVVLEKRPLTIVFNNGRLFLNWHDKLLTPNSGGYATFLVGNKWYSSPQADWEVKKEGENKLLATGKFYQLALTQIWRLEIIDNYEIKWDIEMDSEEPFEIQEAHTNILLTSEYTSWFTTLEKDDFPAIDDKNKNWQALIDGNISRKCIGVEAKNIADGKIPSLVFEQFNTLYLNRSQILNSDYLNNCRILQYKTLSLQNYATCQKKRFMYFSGKIIMDIPDINNYLERLQDEFILSNGKSKWVFNNGQCIISYNDIPLTDANHVCTWICVNGRKYSSDLAHWEVKKEKGDKLIAKGMWQNLPIVQIWEIEKSNESSFVWRVNLQVNAEVDIEELNALFMCCQDYRYWFSEYTKGGFPEAFLETEMDMVQKCIQDDGIIGFQSRNNRLPTLSLKFSKELDNFAKILNSDFYTKARILRIIKVQPEQNVKFLPGQYPCFVIEVILNKEHYIYPEDLTNTLQNGKLKFIFDNGRGRIYWDGLELTKKLGLYTSLRSKGRWYDSTSSALWKIKEINADTIMVSGKWLHLPIQQYWEMRVREDNVIEFSVKMKIDKEIEVDRLQTNIMISEKYKDWITNKEKGSFPEFRGNIDDDWEVLWSNLKSKEQKQDYIGVLKNYGDKGFLPTVIFLPEEANSEWFLNVINSDLYHRGRVLQYLKKEKAVLLPGEYHYYKGRIRIEGV